MQKSQKIFFLILDLDFDLSYLDNDMLRDETKGWWDYEISASLQINLMASQTNIHGTKEISNCGLNWILTIKRIKLDNPTMLISKPMNHNQDTHELINKSRQKTTSIRFSFHFDLTKILFRSFTMTAVLNKLLYISMAPYDHFSGSNVPKANFLFLCWLHK